MTTRHQSQTPNKNVGGSQITDREARRSDDSPAQQEARRRAGEPGIAADPDSDLAADNPDLRVSANKRGGGGHGGTSKDRERGK